MTAPSVRCTDLSDDVSSLLSATRPLSSPAPCDPEAVTADLHCPTGSVTVSWRSSAGASSYTVLARADGHTDSCHSESTSCELEMLQCGRDYIVTVLAGDGKCNSSALAMTGVTTGEEQLIKTTKTKLIVYKMFSF